MADNYLRDVKSLDLLVSHCRKCRGIGIHGFPHQIEWAQRTGSVTMNWTCEACGAINERVQLTVDHPVCGHGCQRCYEELLSWHDGD